MYGRQTKIKISVENVVVKSLNLVYLWHRYTTDASILVQKILWYYTFYWALNGYNVSPKTVFQTIEALIIRMTGNGSRF